MSEPMTREEDAVRVMRNCVQSGGDTPYPGRGDMKAILRAIDARDAALAEGVRLIRAMLPDYCPAHHDACIEATCVEARAFLAKHGGAK